MNKPHAYGKQWGSTAFDNDSVTYNRYIVNAPQRIIGYEKAMLCLKMLNPIDFHYRRPFSLKCHAMIYNQIESFCKDWSAIGINTENFIRYLVETHLIDEVGGPGVIRDIFQNLEVMGGIPQ
ncbi:MAG: hypothetical protein FWG27_03590 [Treponema sp.]|nr:hypothetical protein [Treponema sp.]